MNLKKSLLVTLSSLLMFASHGQTITTSLKSNAFGTERGIKIQLPRNYEKNKEKVYPLIVVFNGDYLFEPVSGVVTFTSYWDDMPESIVVGVDQELTKNDDFYISDVDYIPTNSGARFLEFVTDELVPYIEDNYRVADFKVGIGHGQSANFLNFFFFQKTPLFQSYISLSPSLSPEMSKQLPRLLGAKKKRQYFYYLATASDDFKNHTISIKSLNQLINIPKQTTIGYGFDSFSGASHYSLVVPAITSALHHTFKATQPINKQEYQEKLLPLEGSLVDYLIDKYLKIEEWYGINENILINDFKAIESAIEKKEAYKELKDLAALAMESYSDTVLPSYFLGRYFELINKPNRAINAYRSAFGAKDIGDFYLDDLMDRADDIENNKK